MTFQVPNKYRIRNGKLASTERHGNNGAFVIPYSYDVDGLNKRRVYAGYNFFVIASEGEGWEHVSVTIDGGRRCATWEEMCFIKSLFWEAEDSVVQFHPPKSEYVNYHPHCLHMWRPIGVEIPRPPTDHIGPKGTQHDAM